MPDVIIKGMEMPESCADCPIEADDFDECPFMHVHPIREAVEKRLGHRVIGWRCNYDKRPDWCPLSPAPEWISVEERLPEQRINQNTLDFEYVLCATTFGDVRPYKYGSRIGQGEAHFWNGAGYVDAYVTHWMPLPEPPEGGDGDG